ncbi:hypothetical protein RPMA_02345 [Tardiphaga alba]|uniref:Uncharacterized protein n=1 Tax=Tardiphaga alba TaxID=340268 RepID=A0ABX8A2R3_9BRAD|nr:hypothetical protein [Tardiphaga alba]QUS37831.1 hypothetical protein RPMA_02345 [Tardiphaga alba]
MMQNTWRRRLVDRHPEIFVRDAEGSATAHGYPFVGDGWADLVEVLAERIATFAPRGSYRIDRIEEKHGTLVVGLQRRVEGLDSGVQAAIDEAVALAEARSACTCQICGNPGVLREQNGWLATLCDDHARGEVVQVRPGWENVEVIYVVTGGHLRVSRARRYDRASDSFVDVAIGDLGDLP